MKKFIVFLVAVGLVLYGASPLFAGGAINKNNLSAEYIRTMNRAAATDAADIVAYNPAGTTAFEDGLYGNFSFQYIDKEYENTFGGTTYSSDEPSTIPEFYTVYKKDKWAGFFGFNVPLGGGKIEYGQGNAMTKLLSQAYVSGNSGYNNYKNMKLEGQSYGLGYTFGGAYRINEMFSVSLAARFIDAEKELQGSTTIDGGGNPDKTATVDLDYTADGWGGIIGLDIFVNKDLTIGLKYETKTSLLFTYEHKSGTNTDGKGLLDLFEVTNGKEAHEDQPAMFSSGVSYQVTPAFRVEPTFTYYFNKDADLGGAFSTSKNLEDTIANGYDLGVAFEYAFNEKWKASLGLLYTDTGVDPNDMSPNVPELNARSICTGFAWQPKPDLVFNFGIGKVDYFNETTDGAATTSYKNVEYSKDVVYMGLGVEYKFF